MLIIKIKICEDINGLKKYKSKFRNEKEKRKRGRKG